MGNWNNALEETNKFLAEQVRNLLHVKGKESRYTEVSIKKPIISVIIPVYNVEEYLAECLHSVISQSIFNKVEIIAVDDCSPDNSISILKEYETKYSNIKIVRHVVNRGLPASRNSALSFATGEYIFFLDSDDTVPDKKSFEILLKEARDSGSEMVLGLTKEWYYEENKEVEGYYEEHQKDEISGLNIQDCPLLLKHVPVWNRLIKFSFLKEYNIFYNEDVKKHEDNAFSLKCSLLSKKISFKRVHSYNYRIRSNPQNPSLIFNIKEEDSYYKALSYDEMISFLNTEIDDVRLNTIFFRNQPGKLKWLVHKTFEDLYSLNPSKELIKLRIKQWSDVLSRLNSHQLEAIQSSDFINALIKKDKDAAFIISEELWNYLNAEWEDYLDYFLETKDLILSGKLTKNEITLGLISLIEKLPPNAQKNSDDTLLKVICDKNFLGALSEVEKLSGIKFSREISLVVPVFNSALFINDLYKSLLNQSFTDFEVIFVDDNSEDNSCDLISSLMVTDDRIRLIKQKMNLGPGACRNLGLKYCTGKYVRFIDADDRLPAESLKILHAKIKELNVDAVRGSYTFHKTDGSIVEMKPDYEFFKDVEDLEIHDIKPLRYGHWCFLFKTEELRRINAKYPNMRNAQDTAFLHSTVYKLNSIAVINDLVYEYIEQEKSIMTSSKKKLDWFKNVFIQNFIMIKELGKLDKKKIGIYYLLLTTEFSLLDQVIPQLSTLNNSERVSFFIWLSENLKRIGFFDTDAFQIAKDLNWEKALSFYAQIEKLDIKQLLERTKIQFHENLK